MDDWLSECEWAITRNDEDDTMIMANAVFGGSGYHAPGSKATKPILTVQALSVRRSRSATPYPVNVSFHRRGWERVPDMR